MTNADKLANVTHIRYEPFFGGSTIVMTIDDARDQFGCLVEALQGYCSDGAVFPMDKNGEDIFIEWE
jgi:hypothetical protein|tara:strand:+ start:97 stop:297 length:201 start_codon:yes stop_codon:yes gene_type:complete